MWRLQRILLDSTHVSPLLLRAAAHPAGTLVTSSLLRTRVSWDPFLKTTNPSLWGCINWVSVQMGASSSKAARTASGAATRKYPSRPSPSTREPQQAPQLAVRQDELPPHEALHARERHGLRGEGPSEGKNEGASLLFSRSLLRRDICQNEPISDR